MISQMDVLPSTLLKTALTLTCLRLIPKPQDASSCYRRKRDSAIMHSCIIHAKAITVDMSMRQLIKTCSQHSNICHVLYLVRVGELAAEQTVYMAMCASEQTVAIELVEKAIVVSVREFAPQITPQLIMLRLLTTL